MAKFTRKPAVIEAICITQPMVVDTATGIAKGKPGDWLITSLLGEEYFVTGEAFYQNYEPVDECSTEYLKDVKNRKKFGFR